METKNNGKEYEAEDFRNIIESNEKISTLTSYGVRIEIPESDGIIISWSNGSKSWWYWGDRKKGIELKLDANMLFLPITKKQFDTIQGKLNQLPLYRCSFEAKERGEVDSELATLEWAIKQLERIEREKGV